MSQYLVIDPTRQSAQLLPLSWAFVHRRSPRPLSGLPDGPMELQRNGCLLHVYFHTLRLRPPDVVCDTGVVVPCSDDDLAPKACGRSGSVSACKRPSSQTEIFVLVFEPAHYAGATPHRSCSCLAEIQVEGLEFDTRCHCLWLCYLTHGENFLVQLSNASLRLWIRGAFNMSFSMLVQGITGPQSW